MQKWKVCIEKPFVNCDKIYPIQQKKVKILLEQLEKNSNVLKVIVFGSSVTCSCHVDSDIDIYVECIHEERGLIQKYMPFSYDLWTNFSADDNLKKEIFSKGVTIYDNTKRNTVR